MSVILFDWSGTLSNFRKKDLLNGKKVINEKLTPLLQGNRIGIISNTSKNAEELINAVKNEFERVKLQVEIQVYNTLFQNGDLFRKPSPWMIWYALYKMNIQDFYGSKEVVKEVSIEVNKGEIVGLLGPNGAGKTTSFYMIVGLIKPNSGKVFFDG